MYSQNIFELKISRNVIVENYFLRFMELKITNFFNVLKYGIRLRLF